MSKKNPGNLVFGLDIGTRSIVGTVGYRTDERFHVIAQESIEHETRAMLDGQINDIDKVGRSIQYVKDILERKIEKPLNEVCIAAAGRVLKTVTTSAEIDYQDEVLIDPEQIYLVEMLGVEKAYEEFNNVNSSDQKFFCVGYSVIKYIVNGYPMMTPERHKAKSLGVELIATFLPDDVVDGLYKAVEIADLHVANLTLEPIAAMQAAVPDAYRMLNIALVDVGAGTSDISITKDGSIIAYGMIAKAGDELTEVVARHTLSDFNTAEKVKTKAIDGEPIEYEDIMGLTHTIEAEEVLAVVGPTVDDMTADIASKIIELNGGKPVSAVFVVGGGGKIPSFTEKLAEKLGILKERCALRGKEVLKDIDYQNDNPMIDSMYVTPIGICLNFFDQKNNFIFVNFNSKRIKLYDNGHLTVADAAMQAGFPNESLFPRRGAELSFTVNGNAHLVKGEIGEPASIMVNDKEVNLSTSITAGDKIKITESKPGLPAVANIKSLKEFGNTLSIILNDKLVKLPMFAEVNGELKSELYSICTGDVVKILNYVTVKQIVDFMDLSVSSNEAIYVNNRVADLDTVVYENFSVNIGINDGSFLVETAETEETYTEVEVDNNTYAESVSTQAFSSTVSEPVNVQTNVQSNAQPVVETDEINKPEEPKPIISMMVYVNDAPITLRGKSSYVYVDVFDYINFDLRNPGGKSIVTNLNGVKAQYMQELKPADRIEIRWEDKY